MSAAPASAPARPPTRFRWVICGLLFSAITINYVDRALFGFLAPELKKIFGWDSGQVAEIALWFEVAYAIGMAFVGRVLDRAGTRLGLGVAFAAWCIASMMHASMATAPVVKVAAWCLATFGVAGMATVLTFKVARFFLGITEAGAYPGVAKAAAEWFPRRERAIVAGFFNAGSNVGSMIVPLVAPWLFFNVGWQWTFIAIGGSGLVWIFFWFAFYRLPAQHPQVSPAELAIIESDPPDTVTQMMPLGHILATRQAWSFIMGKFFSDMMFRWCISLLPLFFSDHFGISISKVGLPFFIIYLTAACGSIGGGWLSSSFLQRGWPVNRARKTAMLICVLCVLPVMLTTSVTNPWVAVLILSLMMAAHQGWSSNLYTSISDMFPKHAVGAVAGIGGTAGTIGTIALLALTASMLNAQKAAVEAAAAALTAASAGVNQAALATAQTAVAVAKANADHTYTVVFIIAGFAYLAALGCFHLLVPKMEPVKNVPAAA